MMPTPECAFPLSLPKGSLAMSLETRLREQREHQPILLMTHIVCGYPSLEANWKMLSFMNEAGVALVEFQFPFSEPTADGPLFCKANQTAIENGITTRDCFDIMSRASAEMTFAPLMMGYYNTVYKMGHEVFCQRLAAAGGRGYILADLPPEEADVLEATGLAMGLEPIHLMTPTSSDDRLRLIATHGRGFFYCVARRGVTGAHTEFGADLDAFLARCRQATSLPLAVGFGVSSPEDVHFLKGRADIAVVGTAVLQRWETEGEAAARELILSLAQAAKSR